MIMLSEYVGLNSDETELAFVDPRTIRSVTNRKNESGWTGSYIRTMEGHCIIVRETPVEVYALIENALSDA